MHFFMCMQYLGNCWLCGFSVVSQQNNELMQRIKVDILQVRNLLLSDNEDKICDALFFAL